MNRMSAPIRALQPEPLQSTSAASGSPPEIPRKSPPPQIAKPISDSSVPSCELSGIRKEDPSEHLRQVEAAILQRPFVRLQARLKLGQSRQIRHGHRREHSAPPAPCACSARRRCSRPRHVPRRAAAPRLTRLIDSNTGSTIVVVALSGEPTVTVPVVAAPGRASPLSSRADRSPCLRRSESRSCPTARPAAMVSLPLGAV